MEPATLPVDVFHTFATTFTLSACLFPPHKEVCDGDSFDYIVVGSGTAGSVVASRLSEDRNVTVLLLEAGGDPPVESILPAYTSDLKNTKWDWNYVSEWDGRQGAHPCGVTDLTRGKMLGGSSSMNYMLYFRGNPVDFDAWANIVQDASWNYNNLLPYFKKSENLQDPAILSNPYLSAFHGTNGNIGVTRQQSFVTQKYLEAFNEIGHDILLDSNGVKTLGYQQPLYSMADGIRQSSACSFLSPAKDRSNLHVAKHTLVTKVLFDKYRNAVAVEALPGNGQTVTLKANREIILSAGSINTPQLLMLSGIGPRKHLDYMNIRVIADLPVGENLQDHNGVVLVYPTGPAPPKQPTNPYINSLHMINGFVAMRQFQNYPDYQPHIGICDKDTTFKLCILTFGFEKPVCQKFHYEMKGREGLFVVLAGLHPKSRGRILLRSTNPLDQPLIHLGTYSDKRDIDDMISYIKDFDRISGSKYFQRTNSKLLAPPQCDSLIPGSEEYWRCHVETMTTTVFHYAGTCAMGSVVDSKLRVYGVNRLRVADGSVIPVLPKGDTNAPIMMIGEKAADMIKKDNYDCTSYTVTAKSKASVITIV